MAIKKNDKIYTTDIVFQEVQKYSKILKTTPFDERYYIIENRKIGYPIYANQIKLREYNYTSIAGENGSVSGNGKYTVFNTPDYIEYDIIATPDNKYKVDSWSISGGSDATIIGETGKTIATTGKLHINKKCYGDITVRVGFKIAKKVTSLYISSGSWAKQWTGGNVDYSGLVFTATYDDGSTEIVTNNVVLTSPSSGKWTTTQGNQTATFRYTYNDEYRECTSTVYVYKKPVTLTYTGSWSTQYIDESVKISGFRFYVTYSDGTGPIEKSYSSISTSPSYWTSTGSQTCTFKYTENGITVTATSPSVSVNNRTLTNFYISGGSWPTQWAGYSVSYYSLEFKATYSSGTTENVSPTSTSRDSSGWSTPSGKSSSQSITFYYTYRGTTLSCSSSTTVYRLPWNLDITGSWSSTQYAGQSVNPSGLSYKITFYDGGYLTGSASSLSYSPTTWSNYSGTQYCTFTYTNGPSGDTRSESDSVSCSVQESPSWSYTTVKTTSSSGSYSGTISYQKCYRVKLTVSAGQTVTFSSSGSVDVVGYIASSQNYDSSDGVPTGTIYAYDDDSSGSGQFKCSYTFSSAQTCYLFSKPYSTSGSGSSAISWTVESAVTYYRVGGKIFAYDSLSGYTFYDENKNVLSGIGVGSSPYYYSKTSGSSGNIYILYNGNKQNLQWGFNGVSTGASSTSNGASNTDIIMARSSVTSNSIWSWIKTIRANGEYGCNDWFIGSWSETEKLMNSGQCSSYFDGYNVWTSSECSSSQSYSLYNAICWNHSDDSWHMYEKKTYTTSTLITAMRVI